MKKIITFLLAVLVAYGVFQFMLYQLKETIKVTMREEFEYQRENFKLVTE